MNFIYWMYVTTLMLPRDIRFSSTYLSMQGSIEWWRFRGITIHHVFDKIVANNPQKIAIRFDEIAWTYDMTTLIPDSAAMRYSKVFQLDMVYNEPKQLTTTSSTAIYNVITNIPNASVAVLNAAISDHFAQKTIFNLISQEIEIAPPKLKRVM